MSDELEETYTARELLELQRLACSHGASKALYWTERGREWPGTEAIVNALYPLPKVTRPRVVVDSSGWKHCVIGGAIRSRIVEPMDEGPYATLTATAERVRLWHDLFENPTEEIEAEDAA